MDLLQKLEILSDAAKYDVACTSIVFDTSNYPPFVNTTDFYRYAANPVRCVRE